jgi:dTDP-4-dehydrorhamnose reductase
LTTENTARVLVVGGRGNLGRQLLEDLPRAIGTSRSGEDQLEALDITSPDQVQDVLARVKPDCVVNTAAMTSVDGCERDPDAARSIHVGGTANLVRACETVGAGLIQLSTNYVFDGEDGPYDEDDSPNPLSVYGSTKLESERLVLDAGCPGIVVRTAVFYGSESDRPNFLTWALRELANGNDIRIVTDESANPTYVPELSLSIVDLASANHQVEGVYHVAGCDFMTRFEMIIALCEQFDLSPDLVIPVVSEDLAQDAARPPRAGLKIDKIQTAIGRSYKSFQENLSLLSDQLGNLGTWLSER